MKLKVETIVKKIDGKLLEFITIDNLNIEQQYPSSQDLITLLMAPIINSSFDKQPMSC